MGVANKDAFEWVSQNPNIIKASNTIDRLLDDNASHKHPRHSTSFCADIKLGLCDLLVEPPRKRAVRHHRSLPLPGCASPRRTSDEWCVSGDWEFYVSYLALDFPPDSYKLKKQKQLQVCSGRHPPGSMDVGKVGSIDVTCTGGGLMAVVLHGALMATSPQQEFGQAVDQGTTQSP
ncbi:hypothetical protein Ancab_008574 [Ancistrocladus abbreviatus]